MNHGCVAGMLTDPKYPITPNFTTDVTSKLIQEMYLEHSFQFFD